MAIFYRVIRTLIIFFILLGIATLFFVKLVDRTNYSETSYYTKTISSFDTVKKSTLNSNGDTIKASWSKKSITPDFKLPLAGYGNRSGQLYDGIQDSVWAKAMVFDNGKIKTAYVALDLLIVPPAVTEMLPQALDTMGFDLENTYLTATHSHSSIGGWSDTTVGEILAGHNNKRVIKLIVKAIAEAVGAAKAGLESVRTGYSAVQAADHVTNRLVGDARGSIDPWTRFLKVEKLTGQSSILTSFSAHPTCLPYSFTKISGDYPGALCNQLENSEQIDFAMFSAGAMASMAPLSSRNNGPECVTDMSENLAEQIRLIQNFTPLNFETRLGYLNIDLNLPPPQWRIYKNLCVRPWLFKKMFGESPAQISSMRVGDVLFIGVPFDFSGELVEPLEQYARNKNLHIVITGFNGGFNGYITKDHWYDLDKYETRMMNWYGPGMGAYVSEVITKLIDTYAENN